MRIITGTITNGITLAAGDSPVLVGGLVTNDGTNSASAVYGGAGVFATIRNTGTIGNTTGTFKGIILNAAGTIINGSSIGTDAAIEGTGYALSLAGATTIINFGSIISDFAAVRSAGGGLITNGSTADTTALISSGGGEGISFYGIGTVINFGTVASSGEFGIDLIGGGLVNNGSSSDTRSVISGYADALIFGNGNAAISNFGTISGTGAHAFGIISQDPVSSFRLTNGSSSSTKAVVSGGVFAVYAYDGSTVTNFGTIAGTGASGEAIRIKGVGTVVNGAVTSMAALVQGNFVGVYFSGDGQITNFAKIEGSNAGILLTAGGTIVNGSSFDKNALIGNGIDGIDVFNAAAATITNFGTIKGDQAAISFGSGDDKLIIQPGAKFIGTVDGGAGTDTATFIGGGALATSDFSGFEKIALSSTLADTLTLANANFLNVAGGQITVTAGAAGDTVNAAAVTLANRLVFFGGAGNDTIFAGDTASIKGGAGTNKFTFDDVGSRTITDFGASPTNQLIFRDSGFNLGSANDGHGTATALHLNSAAFVSSASGTFTNTSQRFAFNTTTGVLNYDANGSGSGSTAHRVVTLTGHPTLSAGASGNIFFTS